MYKYNFRFGKISILTLLLVFCLSAFQSAGAGKIIYPWRATTAIVKSGESFVAWFDADEGQTINSVELQGPYHKENATISISTGDWEYDQVSGNRYNTRITVNVPSDAHADRYDLVIKTSSGDKRSIAAVKVIKEYRSSYYIMHISDPHFFQNRTEYGQVPQYKLHYAIEMANIIDPEMFINTGDIMYHLDDDTQGKVDQYYNGATIDASYLPGFSTSQQVKGIHHLHAASFDVPGNHDAEANGGSGYNPDNVKRTADRWNRDFGLQSHNFTYDKGRFMMINNAWKNYNWSHLRNDAMDWINKAGGGNFRMLAFHDPNTGMISFNQDFKNIDLSLELMICGHLHNHGLENPYTVNGDDVEYFAVSLREKNKAKVSLYKIDNEKGTLSTETPNAVVELIDKPSDATTPGLYKPTLKLNYSKLNNGCFFDNTATITSKLGFSIEGARVRFVMPKGYEYEVSNGIISQQFDGDDYHIVDVRVDLPANSATVVEIAGIGEFDGSSACQETLPYSTSDKTISNSTLNWSSNPIDISAASSVTISMDIEAIDENVLESGQDYLNIYYKVDGGPMQAISENDAFFPAKTVSVNGISGNTVELIIQVFNSANNETYNVKNILIKDDGLTSAKVTPDIGIAKQLKIYPNPLTRDLLIIDLVGFKNVSNVDIFITNLMGQTIYRNSVQNRKYVELNTSGLLKSSIYFVSVKSGQKIVTSKLIVQ